MPSTEHQLNLKENTQVQKTNTIPHPPCYLLYTVQPTVNPCYSSESVWTFRPLMSVTHARELPTRANIPHYSCEHCIYAPVLCRITVDPLSNETTMSVLEFKVDVLST
jgi:hypothetical protein